MAGTAPQEVGIISDMTLFSEDASSVALTKPQDEWSKLAKNELRDDILQKPERRPEDAGQQQALASAEVRERDTEQLEQTQKDFYNDIRATSDLVKLAKSIGFGKMEDGLLFQIMDQEGEPIFASRSLIFGEKIATLVAKVRDAIKARPNPITITGHTDTTHFSAPSGYTIWKLSADRANETRRILVSSGVQTERMAGISRLAATKPLLPEEPPDASNRQSTIHLNCSIDCIEKCISRNQTGRLIVVVLKSLHAIADRIGIISEISKKILKEYFSSSKYFIGRTCIQTALPKRAGCREMIRQQAIIVFHMRIQTSLRNPRTKNAAHCLGASP